MRMKRGPKKIPRVNINTEKLHKIPDLKKGDVRIITLGGVEEIGKNMTAVEYGNDIVIIDSGFQFKEEDTPGIDFILPNTKYLEERKHKIKALLITHGHLDHIGAIPYVMDKIGNPPIYTREFGTMMIMKRQEEFPTSPALNIKIVKGKEKIKFSDLSVSFFEVDHSIPDSMGIIVETPYGDIINTGDLKIDHHDGIPSKREVDKYKLFKNRKVLMMTLDSTNIERRGWSLPEDIVIENVKKIIKDARGRLIIGVFSSHIDRIISFINYAEKLNKKVVIEGFSMKNNIEIVKKLGLIKTNNIIPVATMEDYPPDKILILSTGAQGEQFAGLMRMANKTHKHIKLNKNDTVLMSSSIIPGNERAITKLKDNLYRHDPKVITYLDAEVHASGHAYREEITWVHKQVDYKFFMPVHGYHYMLKMHAELSESLGTRPENIVVPDNGSVIEITDKGTKINIRKEKAASNTIMVDGFSVGGTQEMVIRDRKLLAEDGIVLVVASIDPRTGSLRKSPDIIARGFVYVKESQDLLAQTRLIIKKSVESNTKGMNPINFDYIKDALTNDVRKFLFQKTAKSPMVIPVIIGV
ncbi:MAG TPA: ribonuclease J [Candidatus Paceibacterota bacterium]|nr:ribonuclease J [Candidatus Paceibacterota bacterium]HJN63025.1 ribonuclease J [Candidatus Paceibacterota bacterium]